MMISMQEHNDLELDHDKHETSIILSPIGMIIYGIYHIRLMLISTIEKNSAIDRQTHANDDLYITDKSNNNLKLMFELNT
ncbi:854_t:CDS:2, partial [Racocetra fulgida]